VKASERRTEDPEWKGCEAEYCFRILKIKNMFQYGRAVKQPANAPIQFDRHSAVPMTISIKLLEHDLKRIQ
jgi:hypothetical protein